MQKLLQLTIYFEDGLYRNFFVVFSDVYLKVEEKLDIIKRGY
jgi:hypothetical protein